MIVLRLAVQAMLAVFMTLAWYRLMDDPNLEGEAFVGMGFVAFLVTCLVQEMISKRFFRG